MKYFLLHIWWTFQAIIGTSVILIVGFTPYVFFGFMGWLEYKELDSLARFLGCILTLWLIMAYCKWDSKRG